MNDKTLVERAVAVPLLERLRRVPNDARLEYEHDPCHHSVFPIGAMCHEAATRIEALEAALREICQPANVMNAIPIAQQALSKGKSHGQ